MALFNITNDKFVPEIGSTWRDFKASNNNIHIDTTVLRISKIQITEEQWLGNI